jgi:hypothetical protein
MIFYWFLHLSVINFELKLYERKFIDFKISILEICVQYVPRNKECPWFQNAVKASDPFVRQKNLHFLLYNMVFNSVLNRGHRMFYVARHVSNLINVRFDIGCSAKNSNIHFWLLNVAFGISQSDSYLKTSVVDPWHFGTDPDPDPDPALFVTGNTRCQQKISFFSILFCLLLFEDTFISDFTFHR